MGQAMEAYDPFPFHLFETFLGIFGPLSENRES